MKQNALIAIVVVLVILVLWYMYSMRSGTSTMVSPEHFYGRVTRPPPGEGVHVWNPYRSYDEAGNATLAGDAAAIRDVSAVVPQAGPLLRSCKTCNPWDPAATAEAQGLAQVGALQHTDYNEKDLQQALSEAYRSSQGYPYAYVQ